MLKRRLVLLSLLGLLNFSLFFGNEVSATAISNAEDSEEVTLLATCQNVSMSIYYQNNSTNVITLKVTGNPGNNILVGIFKYASGGGVSFNYTTIPTSGVAYVTFEISVDGAYEATVEQMSPCASQAGPLFFVI
ncbi:hypothetical protein [Bacillus ndiopicus]|uniref:hypothetical protein n=1 Tax=Bacillus ndiopicus TaxID=1347368 RepID=UPI0005A905F0|nr:hypothetical protein [Bacillus ndiopicus]